MAENKKRKKGREYNDFLKSYGNRNTIDTAVDANDEVTDLVDDNGNVNNIADVLRREQGQQFGRPTSSPERGLAPLDSSADAARSTSYPNKGVGSLDGLGGRRSTSSSLDPLGMQRSYSSEPETSLPSFVDDSPRFAPVSPMGGFGIQPNIRELLQEETHPAVSSKYDDLVTKVVGAAKGVDTSVTPGSPEAKLAAAMANTNPAPRSFWKRLGASLARGASQVQPGDAPETMLGRIIGNVVPGLVPSVDSQQQYKENVAKAEKTYARESAMLKNKQAAEAAAQNVRESQEKIKAGEATRAAQAQTQAILNQTRLDAATKGRAENIMTALSKLPSDDPQRDALAKLLSEPPYNIPVGRNHGLLASEEKEKAATAKATKPMSEAELKRKAEATVKASYDWEEKARSSTDARLDQIKANIRDAEYKGNVTTANRDEYNKRVQQEYNRILQSNRDFSRKEYNQLLKSEMDRIRGTEKQATPAPSRVSRGAKVAPKTNYDARSLTIRLPGAKQ